MEDKVKGYTKITAALAAFVLLFVAIGVSTTSTVSAQAATITMVPISATVLTADAEGFLCLPPALGTAILGAWSEAATTAGEASASA